MKALDCSNANGCKFADSRYPCRDECWVTLARRERPEGAVDSGETNGKENGC